MGWVRMLTQEKFEDVVYQQYFIKQISNMRLNPDTLDKATFCERDEKGDYVREDVSAMWFGWNLYQKESTK